MLKLGSRGSAAIVGVVLATGACGHGDAPPAVRGAAPAQEALVPDDLDTSRRLGGVLAQLWCDGEDRIAEAAAGAAPCPGLIYAWSPLMPLSGLGIPEISEAAHTLGLPLAIVRDTTLHRRSRIGARSVRGTAAVGRARLEDSLAAAMVAAGATVHLPSLVVHREGRILGPALLGYKSAAAYRSLVAERITSAGRRRVESGSPAGASRASAHPRQRQGAGYGPDPWVSLSDDRDIAVDADPGPYFRWVPGRHALAFSYSDRNALLDLSSHRVLPAPGFVDLVPAPDGRLFVTPGPHRGGLEFYDAEQVFDDGRRAQPRHVDRRMRDQYPSVGVLRSGDVGDRVSYRVLTSWFSSVVFRDYEVTFGSSGGVTVRPLGAPVTPCRTRAVSIPILSRDGSEMAARDESTGTTKIYRLDDEGGCEEVLDLGFQTGKVAFGPERRRVAFAIPPGVRAGRLGVGRSGRAGVFVFDRLDGRTTQVPRSGGVNRLTFPEFVGADSVAFLLSRADTDRPSVFRLVCCAR